MKCDYKPRRREKIYNEHLRQIADKKFTIREVDIIACILHNRGEKKIAYFLGISYRTVGSHVRNILNKLEYNCRDQIIDTVEKSGKLRYIREYYLQLVIESTFEKYLQKIGTFINCAQIVCFTDFGKVTDDEEKLLFQLEQDLKLAKLVLKHNVISNDSCEKEYNLCVIREKITTSTAVGISALDGQDRNIGLLLDKNITTPVTKKVIDFREEANYYSSVFGLLQEIINTSELKQTIQEFKNQIQVIIQDSTTESKMESLEIVTSKLTTRIIVITIFPILLLSGIFSLYNNRNVDLVEAQQGSNLLELKLSLKDSIHLLPKFFENLSVRNATREESEKNYKVIKQFDSVIEQIDIGQIQKYFNSDALQSSELVNCLYNLNAVSSYLLSQEFDAKKAEKILKYARNLAENYVSLVGPYKSDKIKVQIDFDKLTTTEVYTELAIIKDLPEMYAITLYFLGRSIIYQRNLERLEEAEKYFALSGYLGNKLGLFEEVLSGINGIMIVKGDYVDINVKNGNHEQARKILKECIELAKIIKEDGREYKINYKPHKNSTFIVPKVDAYHILDCTKRLVKLYTKLIAVTNDKDELNRSLEAISEQFVGSNTSEGVLKILITSSDKTSRIAADIYNNLGYFLLELYDKNIDFTQFKTNLSLQLKLTNGDALEVIYQVFNLAKSLSRSTEFSKADSFDGLLKVCERLIRQSTMVEEEKQLLQKIQDFKEARDEINTKLKRVIANK